MRGAKIVRYILTKRINLSSTQGLRVQLHLRRVVAVTLPVGDAGATRAATLAPAAPFAPLAVRRQGRLALRHAAPARAPLQQTSWQLSTHKML